MTSVAPLTAEALQSLAVETGVVTSPIPAGSNWLADNTKHWAVNVHTNRIVKITTGQGMGQTAIILSNVLGGLVIRGAWLQPIAVGASYMILSVDVAQVLRDVLGGGSDISAANPLEVHDPKVGSLISYEGVTTADGAGGGASLICAALAALPDYDGNQVIVTSGNCIGQARDIVLTTTAGTVTPHIVFDEQILAGTHFVIAAIRTTPAEVAALAALVATVVTVTDPLVMGKLQIAATTIDLNQGIATYVLFTGTTEDVVLEKLTIRMPDDVAGGALVSISIQSDDTTPQVYISAADGAVANLTAEAQLGWTGVSLIVVGATIGLSILGGAEGAAYVCDVIAEYRAVVSGGYLA